MSVDPIAITVVAIISITAGVLLMAPRPHVIARAVTPNGIEMRILQQTGWRELPWFHTWFSYRQPGDVWHEALYDHEDFFWWGSRVSLDTDTQTAVFYRGSQQAVVFHWLSENGTRRWKDHLADAEMSFKPKTN